MGTTPCGDFVTRAPSVTDDTTVTARYFPPTGRLNYRNGTTGTFVPQVTAMTASTSGGNVTVTWTKPAGRVDGYDWILTQNGTSTGGTLNATSWTFTPQGTGGYTFSVAAYNPMGVSDALTYSTAAPPSPGSLTLQPQSGGLAASWSPVQYLGPDPLDHYLVTYTAGYNGNGNSIYFASGQVTVTSTHANIVGLPPVPVTVYVQAVTKGGTVSASINQTATAAAGPYYAPDSVPPSVGSSGQSLPYGVGSMAYEKVLTQANGGAVTFDDGPVDRLQVWTLYRDAGSSANQSYVQSNASPGGCLYPYNNYISDPYLITGTCNTLWTTVPQLDGTYLIHCPACTVAVEPSYTDPYVYASTSGYSDNLYAYLSISPFLSNKDLDPYKFIIYASDTNLHSYVYTITNQNSRLALENDAGVNGNDVIQDTPGIQSMQQWYISPIPGSTQNEYSIINMATGKALDSRGNSSGQPVGQWDYQANSNQRWAFQLYSDGTFQIMNLTQNVCLDVPLSSTTAGQGLQVNSCNYSGAQKFIVQYQKGAPWVTQ